MPYADTYSDRRRLHQASPWVFTGSMGLAGTAGYVNTCLLSFFHVPVSHMTGAVSRLGIDLEATDFTDIRLVASIVIGFLVGAILSGALIGRAVLSPGRRYGIVLMIEGALLFGSAFLLAGESRFGVTLAAMACGVQNAMASSYYGLVIRTTHVTGIVTDIGVMIGHLLRHRKIKFWRILLLCTILISFLLGGLLGAFAVRWYGLTALMVPASGCFIAGAGYFWLRSRKEKRLSVGT